MALNLAGWLFKHPKLLALGGKVARKLVPRLPRSLVYNRFNPWGESRELSEMPAKSFKELYRQRKGGRS
jgi:L-lactate dehydrogenase complex protein LldF